MTVLVREATQADRPEVEALVAEMMPGVDVAARMRWLYETNPGGPAITWLAEEDGKVAGCTSFFPWRLWLDGKELRGALGGDGFVRPAFRRRGIGALLHNASRDAMHQHRITCMYGAPGEMNVTPLKNGGSKEVGQVVRWVRPLRGEVLKVPGVLAKPLTTLASKLLRPRSAARLALATENDPRIDRVWQQTRPSLRLAAVRDSAFYTWRFQQAPADKQPIYLVLEHDQPVGACVIERIDDRIQRLVDVLAPPDHWRTCLLAASEHCLETTPAEMVEIKLLERDSAHRPMHRSLFVERGKKPFLVMIPAERGDERLLDPERWFYTSADSDLDDHS